MTTKSTGPRASCSGELRINWVNGTKVDNKNGTDTFVHFSAKTPRYWYSWDIVPSGPGSVTPQLHDMTQHRAGPYTDIQNTIGTHCTMYYKDDPGSDAAYELTLLQTQSAPLFLTALYWKGA